MEPGKLTFNSYMSEKISVSRSELYRQRFITFFFLGLAISLSAGTTLAGPYARALILGIGLAVLTTGVSYWKERYGLRYPWVETIVSGVLLIIAVAIAWCGYTRHH